MKTYNHFYSNVCALENLQDAYKKTRVGKAITPVIKEFEKNLDKELLALQQELKTLTYTPKQLKKFIIRDPKTRTIHASHIRDRVVHHALMNVIQGIFEPTFIKDSYANQIGKGTHKAVQRLDEFKRKVTKNGRLVKNPKNANSVSGWILKADIKHYFDTVDHDILLNIVGRRIKDKEVIELINTILKNFYTKDHGKGMPLGNLTSQFFANVYLNELDYFVKHELKVRYYLRYVDDFVILHPSKEQLILWKKEIDHFLKEKLKLEIHPDKSKIIPLQNGITFLGYKIFYHHKLLRKSNLRRFEKKFNDAIASIRGGGRRRIRAFL